MVVTALLAALGMSVLLAADAERRIAANAAYGAAALAAADAGVERVVLDLRVAAPWNEILNGSTLSGFCDHTIRPVLPSGGVFDLDGATAELQSESQAQGSFGANNPRWRLFAWGPFSAMTPAAVDTREYIAVWVADDPSEIDGNPAADSNGVVTIHAEARGPGGARRVVEATIARGAAGVVNVVSWREVR